MISTQKVDGREIIQFSEEMKAIYEEALKLEERFIPVSSSEVPEDFVEQMHKDFGFAKTLILDSILPHLSNSLDFFESTFLELSKGGASKAIDFEKSVCSIFSDKLHFKARHTGQLRRPHGVGGFSDVFAVALDDIHCGIIDAKASSSYNLPASDYHQMLANYIPNYTELTGGRDLDLEFCMYVAGGFAGDVNAKLRSLKKEATVGCSAIRAVDLLFLAKKGPSRAQQEAVRTIFKQGDILDRSKFLRL
jgi:hypothetical protein